MAHILSGRQLALTQGRYRWRHDKALRELADVLEVERRRKRPTDQKPGQIQFVRQGEATADKRAPSRKSVLDKGHEWELRADLDRKLIFPNRGNQPKTRRCASVPAVEDVGRDRADRAMGRELRRGT